MKVQFIKTDKGLVPANAENSARWHNFKERLPIGAIAICEVSRDRSTPQHRQYWTVLNTVMSNMPETAHIKNAEELHFATKYQHCEKYPEMWITRHTVKGGEVKTVFSESPSDGITHEQMCRYYDDALQTWADMLGCTAAELTNAEEI